MVLSPDGQDQPGGRMPLRFYRVAIGKMLHNEDK